MSGFSILMFIFGTMTLLTGLYMYTGHKLDILTARAAYKNLKIEDWKKIGKYTMIVSIFIYIIAALVINVD